MGYVFLSCNESIEQGIFAENKWAQKARNSRETELKWQVKENVIITIVSFIWYLSRQYHYPSSDFFAQDLDTFGGGACHIYVLYFDRRRKAHRFQDIYVFGPVFLFAGIDDAIAGSYICPSSRYGCSQFKAVFT